MQKYAEVFKSKGAQLYAVSVDPPANAELIIKKLNLTFPVYSDAAGIVTRKWGVFDGESDIAKPSTFFVLKGGAIAYKYVGADKKDRPTALELLDIADQHKPTE